MKELFLQRFIPRPNAKLRLFCFPYAGAAATVYRLWPADLPADVEVCAIQLPGRGNRLAEAPLTSMPALVDALVPALLPHLDLPFAFFGHSMGAVVAYEVAHALAAGSDPMPWQLFLSGRRPPRIPGAETQLHLLDDEAFVVEINRRYGGIPREVLQEPEILALLLPCLRADIRAMETHRPPARGPLAIPISVFGGADDRLAPRHQLDAWRAETSRAFQVTTFAGGHFYLERQRQPLLAELAASLAPFWADEESARKSA
jgi:medium-chain acyl-[acyl-carrier-protein] hydrolase